MESRDNAELNVILKSYDPDTFDVAAWRQLWIDAGYESEIGRNMVMNPEQAIANAKELDGKKMIFLMEPLTFPYPLAPKMTTVEVAHTVESEGLGYAIQHYMNGGDFEDCELARLWDEAKVLLNQIDSILETALDAENDNED